MNRSIPRGNTERPITVESSSIVLAGTKMENIIRAFDESLQKAEQARIPPLWEGKASERVWASLSLSKI